MTGILGFAALILLLFVIDAVIKQDGKRLVGFGVALVSCVVVIIVASHPQTDIDEYCYNEWDIRVSRTVCD